MPHHRVDEFICGKLADGGLDSHLEGHSALKWFPEAVLHYSLSWAQEETPDRREMSRAVDGSLEALGLEGHEALIVAHEDTRHPHVHVIANRVDPETGKTAKLGNSKLRLSRWGEGSARGGAG